MNYRFLAKYTFLGVEISKYCSWDPHIARAVGKGSSARGQDGRDPNRLASRHWYGGRLHFLVPFITPFFTVIVSPVQRLADADMEVGSSDEVAIVEVLDPFGRGLDVQFSCMWQGGASTELSRISRRETSMGKVGVRVVLLGDPLAYWGVRVVFPNVNHS